ncbi:MAG: hypothetical protein M0T78_00330 [Actinomycetota bacterium]|nr:hypothetical protein [Actinomycetota bacterium]
MAEEKEAKERTPEEAEAYWNWQPGSLVINRWPDGWEVLDLDSFDDDAVYEDDDDDDDDE